MCQKLELRTYHSGLKYLFQKQTLNARKKIWLEFLSEFDFEIKHIKLKENNVADALSRRAHTILSTTISMCKSNLRTMILEAIKLNEY